MATDYQVRPLGVSSLSAEAIRLRSLAGTGETDHNFDVVDLLHHVVLPALRALGKIFTIETFDPSTPYDDPAWVDLAKRTLHVSSRIMIDAKAGDPFARLVLAHEIGHMIFHHDQEMAFSQGKQSQIGYLPESYSAEWQANTFAAHLLLPDQIVLRLGCREPAAVAILTGTTVDFVKDRRFQYERDTKSSLQRYTGDECITCHSFTVGLRGRCEVCGAVQGGEATYRPQ